MIIHIVNIFVKNLMKGIIKGGTQELKIQHFSSPLIQKSYTYRFFRLRNKNIIENFFWTKTSKYIKKISTKWEKKLVKNF